jgi:hypothetical protein
VIVLPEKWLEHDPEKLALAKAGVEPVLRKDYANTKTYLA